VKKNGILSVAAEEASGTHDIQLRIRAVLSAAFLWRSLVDSSSSKNCCLLDFLPENVPHFEQSREKPEKTCGNRRKSVDKAPGKAEGELRYGSPHPHEY
jgi:hypothetical protein